jgi:hypothetical protein
MLLISLRIIFVAVAIISYPHRASALQADSPGKQFAKDTFISAYMQAVQIHPELVIAQYAYLGAVSRKESDADSEYEKILESKSFNETLTRVAAYLPQVGIGVNLGTPFAGVSVNYNLDPLIANIMRGIAEMKTPDEIVQAIKSVFLVDPSAVAGLGGLTWDAWENPDPEFAKLHSLYGIARQYLPTLPSPDAKPSAYIDAASPFVTPLYDEIRLTSGIDVTSIRENWDALIEAVPRKRLGEFDPNFGSRTVRDAASSVANAKSPATLGFVLGEFAKGSNAPTLSVDPGLDGRLRKWLVEKASIPSGQKRSYDEIREEWKEG